MIKRASGTSNWSIMDTTRSPSFTDPVDILYANTAAGDNSLASQIDSHVDGFTITSTTGTSFNASGSTYIYMAIREE